jgi:folate-binding protein YgfZ
MKKIGDSSELKDLGALRLRGPDAVRFLQGQLSSDVTRLTPEQSQLAGYHNPQGRVIALLRLVQLDSEDLLAITPRELVQTVASRLTKFILRAKVKITDESASWAVRGLVAADTDIQPPRFVNETGNEPRATIAIPERVNAQTRLDGSVVVCVGDAPPRWLLISPIGPTGQTPALSSSESGDRESWRRLDIAAGQPQVYASTSEEFVAQMLNLDVLDAIAFDKGCYTGQEVIARAHYRGRVKRRLQRFNSRGPLRLSAGDSAMFSDGRAFKVVEAAQLPDGRCEFLAVALVVSGDHESPPMERAVATSAQTAPTSPIEAEQLPLPYSLPE